MMNQTVEVKEMNLTGMVIDMNDKFVWVETSEDIYCIAAEKVELFIPEVISVELNEFEAAMQEAGINYDGYSEGENLSYEVEGFTYSISVYLDFEYGFYSLETKHKGFDRDEEKEWGNKAEYKKLSTLIRNVLKWADK